MVDVEYLEIVLLNLLRIPDTVQALFAVWVPKVGKTENQLMMVGVSAVFWTIWKIRNTACYENTRIDKPIVVIHMVIHWLSSWSIMQTKQVNKEALMWGTKMFELIANEVFSLMHG